MAHLAASGIRNLEDLRRFEAEKTLDERLPERSILDVFIGAAVRSPDRVAITQIMTGAPNEPRPGGRDRRMTTPLTIALPRCCSR